MNGLMLGSSGLSLLHTAMQAKADLDAGKTPEPKPAAAAAEAAPAAPAGKMSMADKIAAMQKGNAEPAPGKVRDRPIERVS
jgi:hypothetical protein